MTTDRTPGTWARIVLDSLHPETGQRLTTLELNYPYIVHAEFMTHCAFCLAGDSILEFEMPTPGPHSTRRVYKMRLDKFVSKWKNGAQRPRSSTSDKSHSFSLLSRLKNMRIRQANETTGEVQFSNVVRAWESGVKEVYQVKAGKYKVAGSLDHRVLTREGWKTIGGLTTNDFLAVKRFGLPEQERRDPKDWKFIEGKWRSTWQIHERQRLVEESPLCRKCEENHGLHVHHIVPVHEKVTGAFDSTNVTLLCADCHRLEHAGQGWPRGGTRLYVDYVRVQSVKFRGNEPTYDLEIAGEFPNFFANGVVVHNSRNAASSRAIRTLDMIEQVRADPFFPKRWPRAADPDKGMSPEGYWDADSREANVAHEAWRESMLEAMETARRLAALRIHKQIASRPLAPYMHIRVLASATEFENFLNLRLDAGAQDQIQELALALAAARSESKARERRYHLPFIQDDEPLGSPESFLVSARRCAQISFMQHDGSINWSLDLKRGRRLLEAGHMSPFEHQGIADTNLGPYGVSGKFRGGWVQYRKTLPGEAVWVPPCATS